MFAQIGVRMPLGRGFSAWQCVSSCAWCAVPRRRMRACVIRKQMNGGSGSVGKRAVAKRLETTNLSFDDVAGVDAARAEATNAHDARTHARTRHADAHASAPARKRALAAHSAAGVLKPTWTRVRLAAICTHKHA
eukprot:6196552-Pleurochrysis_carterae.AAC.1